MFINLQVGDCFKMELYFFPMVVLFSRSLLGFRLADGLNGMTLEFLTVFSDVFERWSFSPVLSVNERLRLLCCIVMEVLTETSCEVIRVVQLFSKPIKGIFCFHICSSNSKCRLKLSAKKACS